jgi:hypothetical protein
MCKCFNKITVSLKFTTNRLSINTTLFTEKFVIWKSIRLLYVKEAGWLRKGCFLGIIC